MFSKQSLCRDQQPLRRTSECISPVMRSVNIAAPHSVSHTQSRIAASALSSFLFWLQVGNLRLNLRCFFRFPFLTTLSHPVLLRGRYLSTERSMCHILCSATCTCASQRQRASLGPRAALPVFTAPHPHREKSRPSSRRLVTSARATFHWNGGGGGALSHLTSTFLRSSVRVDTEG